MTGRVELTDVGGPCEVVIAHFVFGVQRCGNFTRFVMRDELGAWRYICRKCAETAHE